MRLPRRSQFALLVVVTLLVSPRMGSHERGVVHAEADTKTAPRVAPQKNFSSIFSEVEWVARAFERAEEAAKAENWVKAVRLLQTVSDAETRERESTSKNPVSNQAAPYVVAVRGSTVFEGAWLVAHHKRAGWGTPALSAYASEFGMQARTLLADALAEDSPSMLGAVARRFLPLQEGRRAALHLADRALEQGQRDVALEWLELLADLESVSGEPKEVIAPWQRARLERHADALARDASARASVLAVLIQRAASVSEPDGPFEPLPPEDLATSDSYGWPTSAGSVSRSARAAKRPAKLELKWYHNADSGLGLGDTVEPRDDGLGAPSTWLPPRAVCTEDHAIVSDGEHLRVYELKSGRAVALTRLKYAYALANHTDEDRRERFGFLEGHCLTLVPLPASLRGGENSPSGSSKDMLVIASVPDGRAWHLGARANVPERREDHIEAYRWDGETSLTFLWAAGNRSDVGTRRDADNDDEDRPSVVSKEPDIRMYGAPILYRNRIWVAGVRPTHGSNDQLEAWLYALNPATGSIEIQTHIGTGTPMRSGRHDEVIPTSPSARHGRVVVGTSIGVLAAISAHDGRVLWAYRYPRSVHGDKARNLLGTESERGSRKSSFQNEPPILTTDLCLTTPTDGRHVLVTTSRPVGKERTLRLHEIERHERFGPHAAETIVGAYREAKTGAWRMIVAGMGGDTEPPGPMALSVDPLSEARLWYEPSPTGRGSIPFGRGFVGEDHAFVPTRYGIAVYNLHSGDVSALLDRSAIPEDMRKNAPLTPYGNLIPTPTGGVLSASAGVVAYWEAPEKK